MINIGDMTIIDIKPYRCVKIEDGMAYLKSAVDEQRGRLKKIDVKSVPYFDENGQLVKPPKLKVSRKRLMRFNYMKAVKKEIELPVSHDLAYLVSEHLEDLVSHLASKAERNAIIRGDDRVTASHWFYLEMTQDEGIGYWEQNKERAKDYKEFVGVSP